MTTGFQLIDKVLGGYKRGELVILTAPSSMGKSSFITSAALLQASQGVKVAVYNCEVSKLFFSERASLIQDYYKENQQNLCKLNGEFNFITRSFCMDFLQEFLEKSNLDIIYLDFLMLTQIKEQDYLSKIKDLALSTNTAIVVVAQVHSKPDYYGYNPPTINDLYFMPYSEVYVDKLISFVVPQIREAKNGVVAHAIFEVYFPKIHQTKSVDSGIAFYPPNFAFYEMQ